MTEVTNCRAIGMQHYQAGNLGQPISFTVAMLTRSMWATRVSEGGKEILRVVKVDANDTSISPLQSVTMLPCNSDALNYPEAGGFGQGTAVKLLSGMGRHGIAYCVGIQDHNSNPTDVVLAPCDYYDGDAQLNQFWQRRYIYNNFVPLVRKANGSNGLNDSDSWPILPPADNAEVQNYRAGHDGRDNTTYLSFTLSGMSD